MPKSPSDWIVRDDYLHLVDSLGEEFFIKTLVGEVLDDSHLAAVREWVAALRSGKFTQCKGTLRLGDHYCCLGVACELSGVGEWRSVFLRRVNSSDFAYYVPGNQFGAKGMPPDEVQRWLGDPFVHVPGGDDSLIKKLVQMNDSGRYTFEDIANAIEFALPQVKVA